MYKNCILNIDACLQYNFFRHDKFLFLVGTSPVSATNIVMWVGCVLMEEAKASLYATGNTLFCTELIIFILAVVSKAEGTVYSTTNLL